MFTMFVAILCLIIAAVMISASVSDIRSRIVSDVHWYVMCAIGIPLTSVTLGGATAVSYLATVVPLATYMCSERLVGFRAIPFIVVPVISSSLSVAIGIQDSIHIMGIPISFLLLLGLYRYGIGGADVKCLMTLAMVMPVYPGIGWIPIVWSPVHPLDIMFTPTFSILALSLVMSMSVTLWVLYRNIRSGDPIGFRTYLVDSVDEVREAYVDQEVGRYRVEPLIPFIVPLTVSFILIVLFGSPLFAFI